MESLKIIIGFVFVLLAWAFIYRTTLIIRVNAWIREYIFSDKLILFSNRRMAILLFLLGCVALFSGLEGLVEVESIKPEIAHQMIVQAKLDFRHGDYSKVITRCKVLVRAEPKNEAAWELLANAWWAMGDRKLAVQAMETLIRINPDFAWSDTPLGKIVKENRPYKK